MQHKAPLMLFTDGSVHPPSGVGYGAYLATTQVDPVSEIHVKRFENTASSRLEIETLIWALQLLQPESVTIYTDSQTIIGLPGRRARLEERNYLTSRNNPVKHADLYQKLFCLTDQFDCTFVKVKGHRVAREKSAIDRLFTKVDRAARKALRSSLR